MPYRSKAQRDYFNANRERLEKQGVDVDEWNKESEGKDLPDHSSKEEHAGEFIKNHKSHGKEKTK